MAICLAVESSGLVASAAVVEDSKVICEYSVNLKLTHSETLLPMVDTVVKRSGIALKDVDFIAVSKGPGSFTGLRIGSATAKGLAFSMGCPIVGVPTTETLASNIFGFDGLICPLMDARRNQVYTGLYRNTMEGFEVVEDSMACPIEDIVGHINAKGLPVIFLGDGVPVFMDYLKSNVKTAFSFAPININMQNSASLAVRALQLFKEGCSESAFDHAPEYLRLSQAERVKLENS